MASNSVNTVYISKPTAAQQALQRSAAFLQKEQQKKHHKITHPEGIKIVKEAARLTAAEEALKRSAAFLEQEHLNKLLHSPAKVDKPPISKEFIDSSIYLQKSAAFLEQERLIKLHRTLNKSYTSDNNDEKSLENKPITALDRAGEFLKMQQLIRHQAINTKAPSRYKRLYQKPILVPLDDKVIILRNILKKSTSTIVKEILSSYSSLPKHIHNISSN
jgi:hypothetical protein